MNFCPFDDYANDPRFKKEIPRYGLIFGTQGYKCDFPPSKVSVFLHWLNQMEPGKHGEPTDFDRTPLIPSESWKDLRVE